MQPAVAVEINADWLLMDERLGRHAARHFGLGYIGLIGILKVAKQRGEIAALRPLSVLHETDLKLHL